MVTNGLKKNMELTGKLSRKLGVQSGVSKTGRAWNKIEFVVTDRGKNYAFGSLNADVIQMVSDTDEGTMLRITYEWESREYNGKFYTNATAFVVEKASGSGKLEPEKKKEWYEPEKDDADGDLPF